MKKVLGIIIAVVLVGLASFGGWKYFAGSEENIPQDLSPMTLSGGTGGLAETPKEAFVLDDFLKEIIVDQNEGKILDANGEYTSFIKEKSNTLSTKMSEAVVKDAAWVVNMFEPGSSLYHIGPLTRAIYPEPTIRISPEAGTLEEYVYLSVQQGTGAIATKE